MIKDVFRINCPILLFEVFEFDVIVVILKWVKCRSGPISTRMALNYTKTKDLLYTGFRETSSGTTLLKLLYKHLYLNLIDLK